MRVWFVLAASMLAAPAFAQAPTSPRAAPDPLMVLPPFPWAQGAAAPQVAGLRLDEPKSEVVAALGPADAPATGTHDSALLYASRGLAVQYGPDDHVTGIKLLNAAAGAVGTVHVGDTFRTVVTSWGRPLHITGPYAIFGNGQFLAVAEIGPGTGIIQSLQVTRSFTP